MLDEGVEIAAYKNLVGLGLHIQALDQIADESYEHLIIATSTMTFSNRWPNSVPTKQPPSSFGERWRAGHQPRENKRFSFSAERVL